RSTRTSAPAGTSVSCAIAVTSVSVSTWPATTAAPSAAPGAGPYRYQPSSTWLSGMVMAPLSSTPTGTTGMSIGEPSTTTRTGAGTFSAGAWVAGETGIAAGAAADCAGAPAETGRSGPASAGTTSSPWYGPAAREFAGGVPPS